MILNIKKKKAVKKIPLVYSFGRKTECLGIKFSIVQTIVTALLTILKDVFPCLTKHGKNSTKTKSEFIVSSFCPEDPSDNSEFLYVGLAKQLQRLVNSKNHTVKNLKLKFNMDGLPLFKSGGMEFWPILEKIHFYPDLY